MSENTAKLYLVSHNPVDEYGIGLNKSRIQKAADYYKIGIATDPERRLSVMQSGSPHRLELETTVECDQPEDVESDLHSIYRPYHKLGEWFSLPSAPQNSLRAVDYLSSENTKVLSRLRNTRRWDWEKGFYVQLMEIRDGEITLREDGIPSK
jgi:hypothetical protein